VTFALLSFVVSAAFAAFVLQRYVARKHAHTGFWAIGLVMFSFAALAGALARSGGATETEYRLFYLFGAILNVAWLALGTIALLTDRPVLISAVAAVGTLSVVAIYAVFTSPVDLTAAVDTGKGFADSPLPRLLAGIGSGLGSVILAGGALWSAWVFLRKRGQGRRALANVLIAAGVFVAAFGGTATFAGASGIVEATNLIGVSLMFAGFLLV
jgi:hypothetical protein